MTQATLTKRRVLLVDDDRLARLSLRTVLVGLDLDVTEASRPDEALAAVDSNVGQFALAVLDLKLAGASGLDLLRDIKVRDPHIEALMITGFETVEAAKRALRLGACDFLTKPFDVPALTSAIGRAIKLHEASNVGLRRERELREMLDEMGPAGVEWVRMLRGIVHDVRNMLCVVRSYHHHVSTVLDQQRQLGPKEATSLKSHVTVIGRQLDTIVEMLNRQSTVWRTESDQPENSNAAPLLQDLVLLVQRHPDARQCEIELTLESDALEVAIPTSDLAELLLNLFLNAAQSAPGRIKILVNARIVTPPFTDLEGSRGFESARTFGAATLNRQSDALRITIRDDGDGITPVMLSRVVTEQFTTKGSRGSGLGLGIVADCIGRNGGAFTIRSTVGKGTEVEMFLPCKTRPHPR